MIHHPNYKVTVEHTIKENRIVFRFFEILAKVYQYATHTFVCFHAYDISQISLLSHYFKVVEALYLA
jgi:hypothetical protein